MIRIYRFELNFSFSLGDYLHTCGKFAYTFSLFITVYILLSERDKLVSH